MSNHLAHTRSTTSEERPATLPILTEDDFCKGKYSQNDKRCYTARLLDIFLSDDHPYVAAYREFRLATMDYLYKHHKDDHAATAKDRATCFNSVAQQLGYEQVPMDIYINSKGENAASNSPEAM